MRQQQSNRAQGFTGGTEKLCLSIQSMMHMHSSCSTFTLQSKKFFQLFKNQRQAHNSGLKTATISALCDYQEQVKLTQLIHNQISHPVTQTCNIQNIIFTVTK